MNDDGGDAARRLLEEFLDDPDADWAVLDGLPMPPPKNRVRGGDEEVGVPLPMPLPANRLRGGDEEVDDDHTGGISLIAGCLARADGLHMGVIASDMYAQIMALEPLPAGGMDLPTPAGSTGLIDRMPEAGFDLLSAGEMDSLLLLFPAFFSWKWRKKKPPGSLADGLQLVAGLDLLPDGEMDSPTYAGSTGISVQRLSGQDELVQATSTTTSTAVAAETHILARTRRPCFGLWSCWFVLASEVLTPLEVVATGHVLAAAGH